MISATTSRSFDCDTSAPFEYIRRQSSSPLYSDADVFVRASERNDDAFERSSRRNEYLSSPKRSAKYSHDAHFSRAGAPLKRPRTTIGFRKFSVSSFHTSPVATRGSLASTSATTWCGPGTFDCSMRKVIRRSCTLAQTELTGSHV